MAAEIDEARPKIVVTSAGNITLMANKKKRQVVLSHQQKVGRGRRAHVVSTFWASLSEQEALALQAAINDTFIEIDENGNRS